LPQANLEIATVIRYREKHRKSKRKFTSVNELQPRHISKRNIALDRNFYFYTCL